MRTEIYVQTRDTGVKYHTGTRLVECLGESRAEQSRAGTPGCTHKAPEHLLSSQPPGIEGQEQHLKWTSPNCPFIFLPAAWRPWSLGANAKSSISSGLPPGSTSLQWQLLECITFFTVSESVVMDLSYSYLKKTIQEESSRIYHGYCEEWEHHRKTRNVNFDINDLKKWPRRCSDKQ